MALVFSGFDTPPAHANEKSVEITPALTVTAATPRYVEWPESIVAYGDIAPWQEASISAQIGGYQLIEVLVNVGDVVKKGQLLARFNRSVLQTEQAELLANVEQASANLKRVKALSNGKAVSEQDLVQAETQAKVAEALLAKNQLHLQYTNVIAPDDGVISARTATLGASIPAGQELFRLILQQKLEWRGEVTAQQYARVQAGQQVSLALPDGTSTTAVVRQKAPAFNSDTRLAIIYADISKESHAVAGMYVAGDVMPGASRAHIVPAESVVIRDGRQYVLSIDAATTLSEVSLHQVITGRRKGKDIEIVSGLDGINRVVSDGAGFLSDGDTVSVVNDETTSGERQL